MSNIQQPLVDLLTSVDSPINTNLAKSYLDKLSKNGFPGFNREEEWKYASTKPMFENPLKFSNTDSLTTVAKIDSNSNQVIISDTDFKIVDNETINGFEMIQFSSITDEAQKLHYKNLIQKINKIENGFSYSSIASFFAHGLVINITKNIEEPIELHHLMNELELTFSNKAILINVAKSCSAKILFKRSIQSNNSILNFWLGVDLGENAQLDIIDAGIENDTCQLINFTEVLQSRSSTFKSFRMDVAGKFVRNNLHIYQNAESCHSEIYGIYIGRKSNTIDNHTLIDHAFPNSTSLENYKGIGLENSNSVFNGKVFVQPDAQKTNAYQSNKNLLLSADATINTKPQLEIYADDVKCSHGATVGKLNEYELFYLRSRGISKQESIAMLTKAFIEEIVDTVDNESWKNYLNGLIETNLILS